MQYFGSRIFDLIQDITDIAYTYLLFIYYYYVCHTVKWNCFVHRPLASDFHFLHSEDLTSALVKIDKLVSVVYFCAKWMRTIYLVCVCLYNQRFVTLVLGWHEIKLFGGTVQLTPLLICLYGKPWVIPQIECPTDITFTSTYVK